MQAKLIMGAGEPHGRVMGESPDTHGSLTGDNFHTLQPPPGLVILAGLTVRRRPIQAVNAQTPVAGVPTLTL